MDEVVEREIRELRSLFWSDHDPDGRAFASLADALRRGGEHDEALELLADGLERHPAFSTAYVVKALVHRDVGSRDEAEEAFRRALALDYQNVVALNGLGRLLEASGQGDEAEDLLERAMGLGYSVPSEPAEPPGEAASSDAEAVIGGARQDATSEPVAAPESDEDEGVVEVESAEDLPVDGGPRTRTMAELYARQGLHDRAVDLYEHLLRRDPGNEELRARLEELRARAAEEPGAPDPGAAAAGEPREEQMEAQARHMSESGHHEPVDSPFAWTDSAAVDEAAQEEADTAGPPVSGYFEALLAWGPETEDGEGAGSREEAHPVGGGAPDEAEAETVDVSTLVLDEPEAEAVDIQTLAPDEPEAEAVDIRTLAPDEPEAEAVDIRTLAPDEPEAEAVDIRTLAPDEAEAEVVDIRTLAPDEPEAEVVDIRALAPDPSHGE